MFKNLFKKKTTAPETSGEQHTIEVVSPVIQGPGVVRLGVGKWVVHNQRVGIIADTRGYPVVSVHYTNDAGETALEVFGNINDIRIARLQEIPESRRPTDAAYAAAYLGYV